MNIILIVLLQVIVDASFFCFVFKALSVNEGLLIYRSACSLSLSLIRMNPLFSLYRKLYSEVGEQDHVLHRQHLWAGPLNTVSHYGSVSNIK